MSNGDVRKVSLQDIQLVQNLIERCLQLYMSQSEVVNTLLHQAKIEPGFTELVWQKLEAENQDFFRAYHLRLIVKEQILRFNQLLERQVALMRQISQPEVVSISHSNGSQILPIHNNTAYHSPKPSVQSIKPENLPQTQVINSFRNIYTNGTTNMQQPMQVAVNVPTGGPENVLLGQGPNVGLMQGLNGGSVKAECGYTSDPPLMFGAENSLLDPHNAIGDASSSFNGGESSSQALNGILDNETSSFGILGQMPRNFSLSDLTADFSNNNDILSYSRSPFLGTDANFLDPHIGGGQQDMRRRDSVSDAFSYDDFASD
ncbi:hypothetical protein STAS_29986 [Striga asiatica]|uniref:Angiotensin-converting enzyme 2 n=1 Tax=Striga asiatica TaxID=4170 RepID=A0A5A7R4E1_STRAF|nr:hypothetical protein STAS_29986 [Striga asiatica]